MNQLLIAKILSIVIIISSLGCEFGCENDTIECDRKVVISPEEFITAPDDPLTINRLELNGDCLTINFSSSGCNGDSWELMLIDANVILESNPPQRNLRLSLKNNEVCDAFITKETTFNIYELQIDRNQSYGNNVKLNIKNSGDQILYEY